MVEVKKRNFLRFLICARDPLRRSAWSKRSRCGAVRICKVPDEPSAGIVRGEALPLWRRANLLLGNWSLEVVAWFARLLSESRGRRFDPRLVRGSFSRQKSQLSRANVVRGGHSRSSGWKIVPFKYKRSTRRTVLQLRLKNRNFYIQTYCAECTPAAPAQKSQLVSANVVRGVRSRSSGCKIATFIYKGSTRSTFRQLWQHLQRATCAEKCAERLRRATCTEQLHKASLHSVLMRVIVQSHHERYCKVVSAKAIILLILL